MLQPLICPVCDNGRLRALSKAVNATIETQCENCGTLFTARYTDRGVDLLPRVRDGVSYVSPSDCEAFLETPSPSTLPESVMRLAEQTLIRAEVEAMDWADIVGE